MAPPATHIGHWLAAMALCAAIVAAGALDWLRPLENGLQSLRFSLASRPASGDIVFVEIDPEAMTGVGNASRARSLYAQVVDKLVDSGASMVVLDVNLRGTMGFFDDNALGEALTRAQGIARTTARFSTDDTAVHDLDLPLERFAALAPPVFVGNRPDRDGVVRQYQTWLTQGGWVIDSLAAAITPERRITDTAFHIDFGIDLGTVPRLLMSQLLAADDVSDVMAGKVAIVGPGSFSMQDGMLVPRYGMVPGTAIQLLAAETVRQNRMLRDWRVDPPFVLVLVSGLLFFVLRRRMPLSLATICMVIWLVLVEFSAFALFNRAGVIIHTATVHVAQITLLIAALWHELELRGRSLNRTAWERDSMRGILAQVISDNFDGVVVVDHTGTIRVASKLAEEFIGPGLRGQRAADVLDQQFLTRIDAAIGQGEAMDRVREVTILRPDGEHIVEFVVTLSSVSEREEKGMMAGRVACLTFRDVTERHRVEERLTFLAQHDPLTGAGSRVRFTETVAEILSTPMGRARGVAVILIGLSRLRTVNDTLGHAYGDELLRQVVERLNGFGAECVARLDGNSFGLLFKGLVNEDMMVFAKTIKDSVSRPYTIGGHHAVIGASVGLSDSDLSGTVPDVLVGQAAMALSIADDSSGDALVVFAKEMDTRIKNKQDMERALRAALARGEFSVHYQPQVDLDDGEVIGVEALVRWTHPELGNISPAEFIPAAEATGLIIEIGRWVLETACKEVAGWPGDIRLSVNVSPMQFEHGDIVSDVIRAIEMSGLEPGRLDIEITESLLVAETTHVAEKLKLLRGKGIGVALDDFGTGYSSLSYLGRLPVDRIKIDQSFVRGLPEDTHATAIVRAVLMLAESLDKNVVAEGIETQDQAWLLRLAGCRTGQGYFFGRPGPAEVMVARLLAREADRMAMDKTG